MSRRCTGRESDGADDGNARVAAEGRFQYARELAVPVRDVLPARSDHSDHSDHISDNTCVMFFVFVPHDVLLLLCELGDHVAEGKETFVDEPSFLPPRERLACLLGAREVDQILRDP